FGLRRRKKQDVVVRHPHRKRSGKHDPARPQPRPQRVERSAGRASAGNDRISIIAAAERKTVEKALHNRRNTVPIDGKHKSGALTRLRKSKFLLLHTFGNRNNAISRTMRKARGSVQRISGAGKIKNHRFKLPFPVRRAHSRPAAKATAEKS